MPKIVVRRKAEVYKEFPISKSQSKITVGSEGDNDLILSDKKVSMHHFSIEKDGEHFFIEDMNSAFGTILNGKKISQRVRIINGDEIVIGEHALKFEDTPNRPQKNGAVKQKNEQKKKSEPEKPKTPTVKTEKKSSQSKQKKQVPHYLLSIYGPLTGKKFQLNFNTTKIGRDKTLNDIIIRETPSGEIDTSISRRHATIFCENGHYFIMDKRSKTRTRVNQRQLSEDDMIELKPNDEIEIVSDKKSSIFRFLPENQHNKTRPKKAGDWWMRNANRLGKSLSFIFSVLLILVIIYFARTVILLNQKPESLSLTEKIFYTVEDNNQIVLTLDEVKKNIHMLSPATADLNGDKFLDLIFLDKIGYLRVINGKTSEPLWNLNNSFRVQSTASFTTADINGDDLADIILPAHNSVLFALDGKTGNEIWASPILGGEFIGSPVVSDFNGDRIQDVCIAKKSGVIHIGWGSFTSPEWMVFKHDGTIQSPLSAGDLDNDSFQELVFGAEKGQVVIFDPDKFEIQNVINVNEEIQKAKGSFFEDHTIRQRIAIGNLNGDVYNDIVLVTEKNCLLAFNIQHGKRLWFDDVVTSIDSFTLAPPNLADLNGDKVDDVVYMTPDNKIIAYNGKGDGSNSKKIEWGHVPENSEQFTSPPVLADINKDDMNDVIVSDFYGTLAAFNGLNGKLLHKQIQMSEDSTAFIGAPLIADFNNNNLLDILVRKNDDTFSLFKTQSKVLQGSVLWGQFNFNSLQNGRQSFTGYPHQISFIIFSAICGVVLLIILVTNLVIEIRRRRLFVIK